MDLLLLDRTGNSTYVPDGVSGNGHLVGIPPSMVLGSSRVLGSARSVELDEGELEGTKTVTSKLTIDALLYGA
jgi:hypothetical protein